jgi:hypothetical protein
MVDDHRQYYANLIAQWAEEQGDGPFYLNEFASSVPSYAAYRLADVIVSNPYAGQV